MERSPGGAAIGASTQCPEGLDEAGGRGALGSLGAAALPRPAAR